MTPEEQRRRAEADARRRREEREAREKSSRVPVDYFGADPFDLGYLMSDVEGRPLPAPPFASGPSRIGPPSAAEESAISGYLSGRTGRPRRSGDYTYGTSSPEDVDWASIIAAMEGQRPGGGGVSVNRGLFNLSETGEEARMFEREQADIEARRAAGETAVRAGFGDVQAANVAAAEKARSMVASAGEAAAAAWSDAAQQARNIAAQQARESGGFEGRAGIDVSSDAGAADFIGFMESQAPAERALAERRQESLGSDLDWMAGMAGAQAEAYAGDLQRQSGILSFERAREHNIRVQDRISQERMLLAQMEQQAQATNASLAAKRDQFDPYTRSREIIAEAASSGNSALLAQQFQITLPQAQAMIDDFWKSFGTEQSLKRG